MNGLPNFTEGGTHAVNIGALKRRLKRIVLARLSNEADTLGGATARSRLLLKGLSGVLNVQVACGIETADNVFIRPDLYPAAGSAFGTIQLTPINNFPDAAKKVYLRPVFQNPALPQQENHPLPQDIPFGWEFSTRADEVEIEVLLTAAGWINSGISGQIVCEVTIEYNGSWWDTAAVNLALGQVTLMGGPSMIPNITNQIG